MDEKLIATVIQIPIVALCFYFVGRQVENLSKKVEEQAKLFEALIQDTNKVTRESSSVLSRLATVIQDRFPIEHEYDNDGSRTKRAKIT